MATLEMTVVDAGLALAGIAAAGIGAAVVYALVGRAERRRRRVAAPAEAPAHAEGAVVAGVEPAPAQLRNVA